MLKAPAAEIARARGPVPMLVRHQLYSHPAAPVIRTVLTVYDDPSQPLRFESFINVAEQDQYADFAALANQERLVVLFYDEQLRHRLSKLIHAGLDNAIAEMLARAEQVRSAIPAEHYDFGRAKAEVMARTKL